MIGFGRRAENNKIKNLLGPLKMCRCDLVLYCYSIAVPQCYCAAVLWICSALCPMTLYKLFEIKVVLNASGSRYFLSGRRYFAQNRMLEVMDGSGEAQKPFF